MESENPGKPVQKIHIQQSGLAGCLWFAAWVFTIGFLHLHFLKAALALILWPYYLGHDLSSLLH
jgi:hypothetical protein